MKYIKDSDGYYINEKGEVFRLQPNGNYYKKKLYKNTKNNYLYCGIMYNGKMITKRVHRLVAEAYIPNIENKPIVNHKNGVKWDNHYTNLEWATVSENTKHSFDNGLQVNAKGYDDSQSRPVYMYDLTTHKLIQDFGSIREASRKTGIAFSTIGRHCKHNIIPRNHKVYFRYQ